MIASPATPARLPGLPDQPQQGLGLRGLEPKEQGHRAPHEVGFRLSAPAGQPLQRAILILRQENLDASHQMCNLTKTYTPSISWSIGPFLRRGHRASGASDLPRQQLPGRDAVLKRLTAALATPPRLFCRRRKPRA